jgi:hypothetical protein
LLYKIREAGLPPNRTSRRRVESVETLPAADWFPTSKVHNLKAGHGPGFTFRTKGSSYLGMALALLSSHANALRELLNPSRTLTTTHRRGNCPGKKVSSTLLLAAIMLILPNAATADSISPIALMETCRCPPLA